VTRGQTTPEFEAAMVALEPGEIGAEPVATRYGFHIIRLERRHDGRTLPYELVADRIAEYLSENVRRRAYAQYVARLASAADIAGVTLKSPDAYRVN
jgi:peptidyl-prolyl cis-trans isomerase C